MLTFIILIKVIELEHFDKLKIIKTQIAQFKKCLVY